MVEKIDMHYKRRIGRIRKQFHEFQELWENKLPQMGVDRKVFCNAYDNLELLDLDKGKK